MNKIIKNGDIAKELSSVFLDLVQGKEIEVLQEDPKEIERVSSERHCNCYYWPYKNDTW
jgi:hypothetical protein